MKLYDYVCNAAPVVVLAGFGRVLIEWVQKRRKNQKFHPKDAVIKFLTSSTLGIVVGFAAENSQWHDASIPIGVASALLGEKIIPMVIAGINKLLPGADDKKGKDDSES